MSTSPTPTIGRIVLVPVQTRRHTGEGLVNGSVEIRPAIVVRVFDTPCENGVPLINVRVFSDGTNDSLGSEWLTSLHYDQDDHRVGTWHWMTYQLNKA